MSTAAVSSIPISQQLQQYFQTRRADLQQLGRALENGDLAGAQTAYNNIVTLGKNGPRPNGDPFLISQREQDFNAIGQALQAGDLAGAQQAFATLRATLTKPGGGRGTAGSGPEIILNLGSGSGTSANPEQITINIANSANGGEQISLSVGNQGSSAQEVTFNLAANTNEQIVLNLLGGAPSASSSSTASGGLSVTA